MSEQLGALLFVAILCGAGAVLAGLLRGKENKPITFGRAWLLGCAALSALLHLPLAWDGRITHRSFALAAATGLAGSAWFVLRWWRNRQVVPWGGWMADLPMAGRVVIGLFLVVAVLHSLQTELPGYDARTAFALKARMLYETGDLTGEDFRDVHRVNFNPAYPLLIPLVEAEMYWFQGGYQQPGLGLIFLCFILAVASIYAGEIRRFASAGVAAGSTLLLLLTPIMIECFEGAGLSGSADLPLCGFVLAGTLELFRCCRQPSWQRAVASGLLLGAAIMTKQEGLLWVGAGGLTTLVFLALGKLGPVTPLLRAAAAGACVLCVAMGLHVLSHRTIAPSPYYPSYAAAMTDWNWLTQLADRPLQVGKFVVQELVRSNRWGLMWLCLIGSLVLLPRGRVPVEVQCWRAVVAIVAAIYVTTMVVTPLHLYYQLSTTLSRLMLHFFPLAMLVMAEQIVASGWMRELLAPGKSTNSDTPEESPRDMPTPETADTAQTPRHLRAAAVLLAACPALALAAASYL